MRHVVLHILLTLGNLVIDLIKHVLILGLFLYLPFKFISLLLTPKSR